MHSSDSDKRSLIHQALGAQLLEARMQSQMALFYLSPLASTGPARGGVPVLFPQFAESGPLRKHGFVRDMSWTLREHRQDTAAEALCYILEIADQDIATWPHAASLQLKVELQPGRLTMTLEIHNSGHGTFTFTGGLHPYFHLHDLLKMYIGGLQGLRVQDRYQPQLAVDEAQALTLDAEPFERLYDGCPDLTLWTGEKQLKLSASGFDQWMVWNPGQAGARELADLPDADWRRFVCVEPVRVARPVHLASGETFCGTLTIMSA